MMATKNYNARDLQQVKTVDTLIDVCTIYNKTLSTLPKFSEKFEALKTKRESVGSQLVQKHQVEANTVSMIGDGAIEKEAIAAYVSENLGLFTEYCQDEKDTTLQSMLPSLIFSKLRRQKPLYMVTSLQSFVITAMKIDFDKANAYGITQEWVTALSNKVASYNDVLPKHSSTKQSKPQATSDLKTSIKEMMSIKKSMDNFIGGFKQKFPEFYNAYNTASIVATVVTKSTTKNAKKPKVEAVKSPQVEAVKVK